jgi:hypothetical protein
VKFETDRITLSLCSVHLGCLRRSGEVSTSVVKWREVLRNRVFIIIIIYTGHIKFHYFTHILLITLCITLFMVVCFVCFY